MPRVIRYPGAINRFASRNNKFLAKPQAHVPAIRVIGVSPVINVTEGGTAIIRISIDDIDPLDISFDYTTIDGTALNPTDYVTLAGSSTVVAGTTFVDISIPTINRSGTNGTRAFTLEISNARKSDDSAVNITGVDATITIVDFITAPLLPSLGLFLSSNNLNEGSTFTFFGRLNNTHTNDVTFNYTTEDVLAIAGVDYTASTGTKTILAGQIEIAIPISTALIVDYQAARTFKVNISSASSGTDAITIHTPSVTATITDTSNPPGAQGHYETLINDATYHVGYSLRPVVGQGITYTGGPHNGKKNPYYANQLKPIGSGGYGRVNSSQFFVYNPGADTHPQAQDACCVTWKPWWTSSGALKSPMTNLSTSMHVNNTVKYERGTGILVGDEIVEVRLSESSQILDGTGGVTIPIDRGMVGSTPGSYDAGQVIRATHNYLASNEQWRGPIGTTDGNTYYWEWDFMFTQEFNYSVGPLDYFKCFNHGSANGPNWFELQTKFQPTSLYHGPLYNQNTHTGIAMFRAYGPATTNGNWATACGIYPDSDTQDLAKKCYLNNQYLSTGSDSIYPMTNGYPGQDRTGGFLMYDGRWIRVHLFLTQNANNWDIMNAWISDYQQGVIQILDNFHMSVGNTATGGQILDWWMQFNSSQQEATWPWAIYGSPANIPPLKTYVKNFVMLKNKSPDLDGILGILTPPLIA